MRGSIAALLARTSRMDAPLLALSAVVVALVCVLSVIVPRVQGAAADASVRAAAEDPDAVVTVSVPLTGDEVTPKPLWSATDETVAYAADKVEDALPDAYDPPVATLVSQPLTLGKIDGRDAQMRLAYIAGKDAPQVTWVEGREPAATAAAVDIVGTDAPTPPVEAGLTAATARLLGVEVGDEIDVISRDGTAVTVAVSGLFAPVDADAWAWSRVPSVLEPLVVSGGAPRVAVVALMSDRSVPFARFALRPLSLEAHYVARPDATGLTTASARDLARDVRALTAAPDAITIPGVRAVVTTRADAVIDRSLALAADASARATVVLTGLLVAAGALLALAASVVARRRRTALVLVRARGASRVTLAGATTAESLVVAAVGAGLAAAVMAGGIGLPGSAWAAPVLAAVLLPPVFVIATVASAETPPTGPGMTRSRRIRQAVRGAVEVVVIAVAVLATVTLRTRGDAAAAGSVTADLVVLGAAPLIAGACAVVALRVAPWVRRAVLALARRGDGAVALLAAVRAGLGAVATVAVMLSVAMMVLAAAEPVPGGESALDPVAEPFAHAADVTRAMVVAALAAIAVVSVVLVGVADRARRDRDGARERALGMTSSRAAGVSVLAAAAPVVLVAAAGVAAGVLAVALVVPGGGLAELWPWWLAVPALGVVAAVVARLRPSRRSLAARLREG